MLADAQYTLNQHPDLLTGVGTGDFIGLTETQPTFLPEHKTLEANLS